MYSTIWTQCAGSSEVRPLATTAWRAVEAQHQIATRKLVDSLEEQTLLESLLEEHKPPSPTGASLHYLLRTPFRYPPLPHGSRFGTRAERGIWYGARFVPTTFAEVAYYRLVFIQGTSADLGVLELQLTVYQAKIATSLAVDLCRPPFSEFGSTISSPVSYEGTQMLGHDIRTAGVWALLYPSARDPRSGVCVAVLDARAFARPTPTRSQTWDCFATRDAVEFRRRDHATVSTLRFELSVFLVDDRLPQPAL